jgi:hypothetical protein
VALSDAVASDAAGDGLSSLSFMYGRVRGTIVPLVHTLARAGVRTTWLTSASKPWIYEDALTGPRTIVGDVDRSNDHALVPMLDSVLRHGGGGQLVVLDTYAGHFPYCGNVPPERLVRWHDWLASLSDPAVFGRHDGSRAAVDCHDAAARYVAATIREALEAVDASPTPVVFVYVPNRGEEVWRQAGRYAGTRSVRESEIPLLVYANPPFAERFADAVERLRAHADRPYESAWLRDAMLDALGVEHADGTPAFERRLSIFDAAFAPAARRHEPRDYLDSARAAAAAHPRGDRLCAHRANSLFKYLEAKAAYGCAEVDVGMDGEAAGRRAYVFHPPDAVNAGLGLRDLIGRGGVPQRGLWLDVKALTERDLSALLVELGAVVPRAARGGVLIETDNLALARSPAARAASDSGFVLSYYLPTDLGRRCAASRDARCEGEAARIAAALNGSAFGGVSFDARGAWLARAVRDRTVPAPELNAWAPSRDWPLGPKSIPLLDEVRMFLVELPGPFWY